MTKKDYYEILGVQRNASVEEIKRAFRNLAKKHHPDANPHGDRDESKFKEISEAYDVLSDESKRDVYNQYGHEGLNRQGFHYDESANPFENFSDVFGDMFGDIFGGGGRSSGRGRKGQDLRYDLKIEFNEAVFGAERSVELPKLEVCGSCSGSGAKKGTSAKVCSACGGRGQVIYSQGFFSVSKPCGRCGGEGRVIEAPCPVCKGAGRQKQSKKLKVTIPPGVDTGSTLRLTGEGEAGERGGKNGDLYIVIQVEEHPIFKREGNDIICEVPISFAEAALGAELEVPALEGFVKVRMGQGTPSGKIFRFKNKGVQDVRKRERGDQLVKVVIEVPLNLNAKQKELLMEFAKAGGEETHPAREGFFKQVKSLFGKG